VLLDDIKKLPSFLSKEKVMEIFDMIKENPNLKSIDYFKNLEETKELWSPAFRKENFLLRIRSTQRIERMNRSIKTKISSKVTLNELFLRLLSLHEEITNHDFEDQEMTSLITHYSLLNGCPILKSINDHISLYAYEQTLLQLGNSLSWQLQEKEDHFQLFQNEYSLKVEKIGEDLLYCSCYYSRSMRIPCQHILACILKFYEKKEENMDHQEERIFQNKYLKNILEHFDRKWLFRDLIKEDEELLHFIRKFSFEVQENSKDSSEDQEENDVQEIEGIDARIEVRESEEVFNQKETSILVKLRKDKAIEDSFKESITDLKNPDVAKTVGRPPKDKRELNFIEQIAGKNKRKSLDSIAPNNLKKIRLSFTLNNY